MLAVLLVPLAIAAPAVATDAAYPSWQEVQNAKTSAVATQAQVASLSVALTRLQSAAAAAEQTAFQRATDAARAQTALDAAAADARLLRSQAGLARDKARRAGRSFAAFTLALARVGGSTGVTARLLVSGAGDRMLQRLTTAGVLVRRSSELAGSVVYRQRLTDAAESQARAAETARTALADRARTAARAAATAAAIARAGLAATQTQRDTLAAQLAFLQNQSADLERRYRIGVQVRAQAAAQAAQAAAAARRPGAAAAAITTAGVVDNPAAAKAYAASQLGAYGWAPAQFGCLTALWNRESGWRTSALNLSSGAYGIPQALPASKMAAAGPDWLTNARTQIDWGLSYITARYGSPCAAWAHSVSLGWY